MSGVITADVSYLAGASSNPNPDPHPNQVRVIHMGAATVVHDANTGAAELAPEPSAQNNRLDLQARYLVITPLHRARVGRDHR